MEHSALVMRSVLGIEQEVQDFWDITAATRDDPEERRRVARAYRAQVVWPAACAKDKIWFGNQFQQLVAEQPHLGAVLILHTSRWKPSIVWLPWSKTVWKFFRAWILIRLTHAFPLIVWGGRGISKLLPVCSLCGASTVDIEHVSATCPGTAI